MNLFFILLGILVNFIWGLAFFVPYYLNNIDPILIVWSRYFFYGVISIILLFTTQVHWRSLTRLDWRNAMLFAFAGNLGYYLALVLAIHYAGIVLPALIVGALPVTMMIYANIKNKEFPFHHLILPIILISTGIIGMKWFQHSEAIFKHSILHTIIGSLWAMVALIIWTWFGVANSNYLKKNFTVSGQTWTLIIGVCCFIQVIILFPFVLFFNTDSVITTLTHSNTLYPLLLGGFILGAIVSWLATGWWNIVSRHLPTTLVGKLLVFETISTLLYGYIHDGVFPKPAVLICIGIVLLGILLGIRTILAASKADHV